MKEDINNDPYFSTQKCVERLFNEYNAHKSLIIALDFDDTIFDYHKKGYTYTKIISLVKDCQNLNFHICIFTGTPKEKWPSIYEYCKNIGIKISSINQNPIDLPFGKDGKMYYNILLDDRAGLEQAFVILSSVLTKIYIAENKPKKEINYEI